MTITEACKVDPSFYLHILNGKPQLKRNHHNSYQMQGVICLHAELIGETLLFLQTKKYLVSLLLA